MAPVPVPAPIVIATVLAAALLRRVEEHLVAAVTEFHAVQCKY